jgi:tetratricopeptide (TPR) repeat protein
MEKEENLVINLIRHEIGAAQSPYSLISRLFRPHPQVTFTRPYHSIIDDNVAILLKKEPHWKVVELPEIAILHYGYTADKIISLHKFERARKAMEGFYKEHPHDPYVCSKLGALYLNIGRKKEGFKLLKHGLKCHGSNPHILYELYYHLGNYYYSVDEFKKSADHFIKAIDQPILSQLKLGAYNNFGGLLYEAENYDTALSVFEKTIEIDPNYADGYYNLGLVFKQLHRLPESIKAYKKALKLNPNNAAIYQNLGVAYMAFGSYNEAIEIWQKGLQLLKDQGNVSRAEILQETLQSLGASSLMAEQ